VDHGIHPESAAVAERVAELAAALGLPCERTRLELGAEAGETAAREARYAWLLALRARLGALHLFLAHHADDQSETVLMRVLEGSGTAGLAGMAAVSGPLVRPLLGFRRAQLTAYVRGRGLSVWIDPANSARRHLRSWIRCDVLPRLRDRLPQVDARLTRLGAGAARERRAWDRAVDLLPDLDPRVEAGGISVAAAPLGAYDSALAQTVLIAVARRAGFPMGSARAARILGLARAGESGQEVPLGGGWRAELAFGRVRVVRVPGTGPSGSWPLEGRSGRGLWGEWRISWRPDPAPARHERSALTAWFSPDSLVVRPWAPGERLRPLAGSGRRLVVRCFQDARVPRRQRQEWPVLAVPDAVVWIPGVCRSDALLPAAGAEALRVDVEHA
jgi:tRNA(Ile)-lysidine synthase